MMLIKSPCHCIALHCNSYSATAAISATQSFDKHAKMLLLFCMLQCTLSQCIYLAVQCAHCKTSTKFIDIIVYKCVMNTQRIGQLFLFNQRNKENRNFNKNIRDLIFEKKTNLAQQPRRRKSWPQIHKEQSRVRAPKRW